MDVQGFSHKDYKPLAPSPASSVLHGQQGTLKKPTHLSKRVGDVVPGVVVYLSMHGWVGGWVGG